MLSASLDNENEIGGQVKVRSIFFAHKKHNRKNGSSSLIIFRRKKKKIRI
jgi:hypothetical protein